MVGVSPPDEVMSPLYDCPAMVTMATTLNWYRTEVGDIPRGGGWWEGLTDVPTRLPL